MSADQDGDHSLHFVVSLLDRDGRPAGIGMVVGPRRIITSAAVVNQAMGRSPSSADRPATTINVRFPNVEHEHGSEPWKATVVKWSKPPADEADHADDFAGLQLARDVPAGVSPGRLAGEGVAPGSVLQVFGYPSDATRSSGVLATVTVTGAVQQPHIHVLADPAVPVEERFGGSPAYDPVTDQVAGLVVPPPSTDDSTSRYLLSAQRIRRLWPELDAPAVVAGVSVLHLSELNLGAEAPRGLLEDIEDQVHRRRIRPELVIVSGDLTVAGDMAQLQLAFTWLEKLGDRIGVPRSAFVIVPGEQDVSQAFRASAYQTELIMGVEPRTPYAYKWRPLAVAMDAFYHGTGRPPFDPGRPWAVHAFPEFRVVVAGLNSTMALSHRTEDEYGRVTELQIDDVTRQLALYQEQGWLRLAAVHHNPLNTGDPRTSLDDGDLFLESFRDDVVDFVLHGHAGDGRPPLAAADLLLLGTGGDGLRYQLIRVDPTGLDRLVRHFDKRRGKWTDGHQERIPRSLNFTPLSAPRATGTRVFDGARDFVDRVRAASLARGDQVLDGADRATIILIRGRDLTQSRVVRALAGPATGAAVDAFRQFMRFAGLDRAAGRAVLVHAGPPADTTLVNHARDSGIDLRTLADYQQLIDLSPVLDRQRHRLGVSPADYLPQQFEYTEAGTDPSQRDDLAAALLSWLVEDSPQVTLVYGDPGSGKSTLLEYIARHMTAATADADALLIDLSWADARTASLDSLLVRHLFDNGLRAIDTDRLRFMVDEGRVVLLVDGFDAFAARVGRDRAEQFRQTLLTSVTNRAKLVLALQPSWAVADSPPDERARRHVVTLTHLSADRITQYLQSRFAASPGALATRIELIERHEHLAAMIRNPRMLMLFCELDDDRLRAAVSTMGKAAALYRELIAGYARIADGTDERWIERWSQLAVAMAQNGTHQLRPAPAGELGPIFRVEGDTASFIDDSVADWLLADTIARAHPNDALLQNVLLTDLAAQLLIEMVGTEAVERWSEEQRRTDGAAHSNAATLRRHLTGRPASPAVPPPSATGSEDLHGQDLRGSDLTQRRLRGADLRGAILRAMTLEGLDLSGARLDGADMRGVRVINGTLEGATVTGSDWSGALLVDTAHVPPAVELNVAAILGRDQPQLQTVMGGMVHCLAVSAVNGLMVIGRGDVVEVVERITDRPGRGLRTVRQFPGHMSTVRDVAFVGPDDRRIVSAAEDGTVRWWDLDTGNALEPTISAHTEPVTAIAVVGDRIVTGSTDGTTRMYRDNGEAIDRHQTRHAGEVLAIAVAPGGDRMVTASADMTAVIRELDTGAELFALSHGDAVNAVAYSHDGTMIATAANDGEAVIWAAMSGERLVTLAVGGSLTCVAFSADDKLLVLGRGDGSTWLWNVSGQPLRKLSRHADRVTAVTFAPWDANEVITVAQDGTARAWNAGTARQVSRLDSDTYWASGLAFRNDADGLRLFASTWDGAVVVWNLTQGRAESAFGTYVGALSGVCCSPDGTLVAAGQLLDPPVVTLWDKTGGVVAELKGHDDGITGVAFSPDGRFLATTSEDRSIGIWDVHGRKLAGRLRDGSDMVSGLAFQPVGPDRPGLRLAVGHGRRVQLWDVDRREKAGEVGPEHDRLVTAVAFMDSGDRLVTATRSQVPTIRDLRDPSAATTQLRGHTGSVNCVAISTDNTKVATGSSDNSVWVFDSRGRSLMTLKDPRSTSNPGHAGGLTALAFSPDGRLLASAARDNSVRIWDTTTRRLLVTFHILRDSASLMRRADGAYRLAGEPADGVWWALRHNRFELDKVAAHIKDPRPLGDDEPLIPADRLGAG